MSITSVRIRTIGILFLLIVCGHSFAQLQKHSTIDKSNYYDYYLHDEKTSYLTEGEIKIILTGELRRNDYTVQENAWYFSGKPSEVDGNLLFVFQEKDNLPPTGIFLYQSKSTLSISDRNLMGVQKGYLRRNEHSDPLECNILQLGKSCYWYQENKKNPKKDFVSRSTIVEILRADIKTYIEDLKKK